MWQARQHCISLEDSGLHRIHERKQRCAMLIVKSRSSGSRDMQVWPRYFTFGRILSLATFLWTLPASGQGSGQGTPLSDFTPAWSNLNQTSLLNYQNDTFVTAPSPPSNYTLAARHTTIYCRTTGDGRTSIDTCRPTLDSLKDLPDFRRKQLFKMNPPVSSPREPHVPPYYFNTDAGDCVIVVEVRSPPPHRPEEFLAWFSWRDVRAVATKILDRCDDLTGKGGMAGIGDPLHNGNDPGWFIMAVAKPGAARYGHAAPLVLGNLNEELTAAELPSS